MSEYHSDMAEISEHHDPFAIREEDHDAVRALQANMDALYRTRQELGRQFQVLSKVKDECNKLEDDLREKRQALIAKYGLESIGDGQWAVDCEKKTFVRLSGRAPVIP